MEKNIKVLDCTLRDGGYCNNWNFDETLVRNYLQAVSQANIDVIEVGLRTTIDDKFLGPFAYTTDEFLNTLDIPKDLDVAVMINAKEFLDNGPKKLNSLFKHSSKSKVKIVRIACHYNEIDRLNHCLQFLKENDYKIILNIMQITERSSEELVECINKIKDFNCVEVLYFADSFGNMTTDQTSEITQNIKENWKKEIGIHTHDNQNNGIPNTLTALRNGVTWLDATILGMGRGAGNSRTEYLLLELNKIGYDKYYPTPLFPLVLGDFKKLKEDLNWGPNLLYYLSANYKVHPTFTQELINKECSPREMIDVINNLSSMNSSSYNIDTLNEAFRNNHVNSHGSWSPVKLISNKEVLILGGGPKAHKHAKAIESYIERKKPIVISLNINNIIAPDKITAYAACHPLRLLTDISKYKNLKRPIIIPKDSLPSKMKEQLKDLEILNFGLSIKENSFEVRPTECLLSTALVIEYVLAVAIAGEAKRILLAGFDGHGPGNSKQDEMNFLIQRYKSAKRPVPLIAITPTTYNIKQSTVYSPSL